MDVDEVWGVYFVFFFFKQKTAYEIGTGDWSSDVCSSDLVIKEFNSDKCSYNNLFSLKNASKASLIQNGLKWNFHL